MTHRALRRRLHDLLDETLAAHDARVVRGHLAGCRACRRELRELEAAEALVRRLPAALVPLGGGAEASARLAGLARWAAPPAARPRTAIPRWGVRAASALAAASLVWLAWLGPPRPPAPGGPVTRSPMVLASLGSGSLGIPAVDVLSATPYTWR
jgi:anti-sigma factor RsiW